MRTQQEILDRINKRKDHDIFGFETDYYISALPFEAAKPYLELGTKPEDWGKPLTDEDFLKDVTDYMPFAWEKANNCRGLSAVRSVYHYIAWLWLLGDNNPERYEDFHYYGKPVLVEISECYGIDWKTLDDDKWVEKEDDMPITAEQALGRNQHGMS